MFSGVMCKLEESKCGQYDIKDLKLLSQPLMIDKNEEATSLVVLRLEGRTKIK